MTDPIHVFAPSTMRDISDMLRWYRQLQKEGKFGNVTPPPPLNSKEVRWAKTTATAETPEYPVRGHNIPVVLGAAEYEDGRDGSEEFAGIVLEEWGAKENGSREERECIFPEGWVPEDTVVRVTLVNGLWWAMSPRQDIVIAVTPPGGIPGRTRGTMGNAWCTLQVTEHKGLGVDTLEVWESGAGTGGGKLPNETKHWIRIHNLSTSAISAGVYVMASLLLSGHYVAVWEDCG